MTDMSIDIPYGPDRLIPMVIPDRNLLAVLEPKTFTAAAGLDQVCWALREPINAQPLNRFLLKKKDILVVVNDASRFTPTSHIIGVLLETVPDPQRLRFLVATGIHRRPSPDEMKFIFGDHYLSLRERILVHDAADEEAMIQLGITRRGTDVRLNRAAVNAQAVVVIGSIEPHYFAGFTGGRKSLIPGIAARTTIEQNHCLALDSAARLMVLKGNPVHEDMMESLKFLDETKIFSIQTVLLRDRAIFACCAGDMRDSFYRAVKFAKKIYCRPISEKADIIVTAAAYPMDIDLYQSQKAIENAKPVLKKGGIIILVSQCRTGIGDRAFYDLLTSGKDPAGLLAEVKRGYRLGYHKTVKLAELLTWAEVWAVTGLPDRDLTAAFIRPFKDLQTAVDTALAAKGPKAKILVLTDGSVTVPIIRD